MPSHRNFVTRSRSDAVIRSLRVAMMSLRRECVAARSTDAVMWSPGDTVTPPLNRTITG
jgi:hypothetical protein